MREPKVALIAVHGVADQSPGDTARAVVDLLVASAPGGAHYIARDTETVTVPVEPLAPRHTPQNPPRNTPQHPSPDRDDTSSGSDQRPWVKALLQSGRSDFQRQGWTSPETVADAWQARSSTRHDGPGGHPGKGPGGDSGGGPAGASPAAAAGPDTAGPLDRGIALTEYLLTKHKNNGARREAYETTRIGVERTGTAGVQRIDVFEMYWADLSRLSGALPRIVTELFTMVFRLTRLGRDTVDEAYGTLRQQREAATGLTGKVHALGWMLTLGLQIVLDWLFVNGLALLVLQLGLLTVFLLGLSGLSLIKASVLPYVHLAASAAILVAGALMLAYRWRDRLAGTKWLPSALLVVGALLLVFHREVGAWVTVLLLAGLLSWISGVGLRIADDRFPFIRVAGRWMWGVFLVLVLASAVQQSPGLPAGGDLLAASSRAVLFGTEAVLFAVKWLWVLLGGLLLVWMLVGWLVSAERGYESRASIATGRLGLCVSLGAFLTMVMAVWAILSTVFGAAVGPLAYSPCLFAVVQPAASASAPAPAALKPPAAAPDASLHSACLWTTQAVDDQRAKPVVTPTGARQYLQQRYEKSTVAFALLAAVLLGLLIYIATMFVPSVLAEMKILVQRERKPKRKRKDREVEIEVMRTRRLGQWLTKGYRGLDHAVLALFGIGVLLGAAVALDFYGVSLFKGVLPDLEKFSQRLLSPLVISVAGIAAAFIAFGGLLSRYLPAVRGPLDVALDVDNHFREFPRTGIPRARIFSRYAALLAHVARGDYDHVVIVAHSQGTVISAELLRFLSSPDGRAPVEHRPQVAGHALPPIHLLTMGCPLRQLYAARFPSLYRWVLRRRKGISGPQASDIGVERWFNAFCSGDYVGRWLWSDHVATDKDVLGHPMVDAVHPKLFGRSDAYGGFVPMPPEMVLLRSRREVEVCLGLGAHTHYFESEQTTVAWLIDHLIETRAEDSSAAAAAPLTPHTAATPAPATPA